MALQEFSEGSLVPSLSPTSVFKTRWILFVVGTTESSYTSSLVEMGNKCKKITIWTLLQNEMMIRTSYFPIIVTAIRGFTTSLLGHMVDLLCITRFLLNVKDVLFVDSGDPWNPHPETVSKVMKMLEGVHRVLKPEGTFISISFGQV